MSIKGTSVEVIVVLVVFPPPLYGTGQKSISLFIDEGSKILSFPFNSGDRNICWYDRGVERALSSPPLYGWDRSKRSQSNGSQESVIDECETLIQIRSISNFLLQDECSYLYQGSLSTHLLCNFKA